jgi:hypothetical protein
VRPDCSQGLATHTHACLVLFSKQQLCMAVLRLQIMLVNCNVRQRPTCVCSEGALTSALVCLCWCWCCRPPFTEVLDRLVQMEGKLEAEGSI